MILLAEELDNKKIIFLGLYFIFTFVFLPHNIVQTGTHENLFTSNDHLTLQVISLEPGVYKVMTNLVYFFMYACDPCI